MAHSGIPQNKKVKVTTMLVAFFTLRVWSTEFVTTGQNVNAASYGYSLHACSIMSIFAATPPSASVSGEEAQLSNAVQASLKSRPGFGKPFSFAKIKPALKKTSFEWHEVHSRHRDKGSRQSLSKLASYLEKIAGKIMQIKKNVCSTILQTYCFLRECFINMRYFDIFITFFYFVAIFLSDFGFYLADFRTIPPLFDNYFPSCSSHIKMFLYDASSTSFTKSEVLCILLHLLSTGIWTFFKILLYQLRLVGFQQFLTILCRSLT